MPGLELSGSDTGSVQSVFAALPEGKQKLLSDIHSEINICLDSFKSKNYEIGKLLSKAKRLLPHVSFHKWVEETWSPFDLKPNTAACLKAIYGKWADKPDIVCVLPISLLQEMKQPTFVFTVNKMIEELVEKNPEAARQINVDSIRKAHRDFKAENIDLPGFEERVKQEIDLAMKIAKGEARKRADRKSRQPLKYGIGDLQKSIKKVQEYSIKIFTLLGFFLPDSASW